MIIENKIDKENMKNNMKLLCKYNMFHVKKLVKVCSIIAIVCGLILLLTNLINFDIKILIIGILSLFIPFCNYMSMRYNTKKWYDSIIKEKSKLFIEHEYVTRRYVFEDRNLLVELDNNSKKETFKFSFNDYYKIWVLNEKNDVIIQFNKSKLNKRIIVINDVSLNDFISYCQKNNIKYSNILK